MKIVKSVKTTSDATLITADVTKFVNEFNVYARKTAESVIGMGETVFNAKANLGDDFSLFCGEIRFDEKSSAIRKFCKIGQKAALLKKYEKSLPASWTTVYRLTEFTDNQLFDYVESGKITPASTQAEVGLLLNKNSKTVVPNGTSKTKVVEDNGYKIDIEFICIPDKALVKEIMEYMELLKTRKNAQYVVRPSTNMDEYLNSASTANEFVA